MMMKRCTAMMAFVLLALLATLGDSWIFSLRQNSYTTADQHTWSPLPMGSGILLALQ